MADLCNGQKEHDDHKGITYSNNHGDTENTEAHGGKLRVLPVSFVHCVTLSLASKDTIAFPGE